MNQRVEMLERLVDSKGIHLPTYALARFKRRLQVVTGDGDCHRICDGFAGSLLVFHPGRVRKSDRHIAPIHHELDIDCVRVARCDSNDQRLIKAMHLFLGPAVGGGEIIIHGAARTISDACARGQPHG